MYSKWNLSNIEKDPIQSHPGIQNPSTVILLFFLYLYSLIMYIISCDLMPHLPAHTVVHFTIWIWQIHSILPYRKYARYGKTSHRSVKQILPVFCIFQGLPKNIENYLNPIKTDRVRPTTVKTRYVRVSTLGLCAVENKCFH